MSADTASQVSVLLGHIDALKAIHRSGGSPSFGQVEQLFDQAAAVRASMLATDSARPAAWPTAASPVEQAARRLVELVVAHTAGALRAESTR